MAVFDFPLHLRSVSYPQTGANIQMGGGHMYSIPSAGAQQRVFELHFDALAYIFDLTGKISNTLKPEINLLRLEQFYASHLLHRNFTYPDPVYGNIVVRFAKPLKIPNGERGGNGVHKDIDITFIEIPKPEIVDGLVDIVFVPIGG